MRAEWARFEDGCQCASGRICDEKSTEMIEKVTDPQVNQFSGPRVARLVTKKSRSRRSACLGAGPSSTSDERDGLEGVPRGLAHPERASCEVTCHMGGLRYIRLSYLYGIVFSSNFVISSQRFAPAHSLTRVFCCVSV